MEFNHVPVFFDQAIDALNIKSGGTYVDCTAGGGGHSSEIAKRLISGRLICIDRDPEAIEILHQRMDGFNGRYDKVTIVHNNFFNIKEILDQLNIHGVDGVLADLGTSSHQLDTAERGFSYHKDAPLDMRMSKEGISAADLVNSLPQRELERIIYRYGEEKFAPAIARGIVRARTVSRIETTGELAEIIKSSVPAAARRENGHPARRTFQALRIEVNGELDGLSQAVNAMFDCLNTGGRLAVITFHSLEDRPVKKCFAELCSGCECPPEFPVCVCNKKPRGKLPFKALSPTEEEIEKNSRCRSARLRVIEKIETV
ncbi:MAG: 16S rRNA (cytosine(1402)-N(4))-methyltransferase RsmH [Clostridiales bacterium]|nr:16S rRNA (cytosine(1402)-N(4))-methyltransferase RsmH [Clostridiales bacterium]